MLPGKGRPQLCIAKDELCDADFANLSIVLACSLCTKHLAKAVVNLQNAVYCVAVLLHFLDMSWAVSSAQHQACCLERHWCISTFCHGHLDIWQTQHKQLHRIASASVAVDCKDSFRPGM